MKLTTKDYLERQLRNFKFSFIDGMADVVASYIPELQENVTELEEIVPRKIGDLDNNLEFQTRSEVLSLIAEKLAEIANNPSGLNTLKAIADSLSNHSNEATIHVTTEDKANWNGKAEVSAIPTKVSQLDNDSGYQTSANVSSAISTEINKLATVASTGRYSDLTGQPTIDSSFIANSTNAVQSKVVKSAIDTKVTSVVNASSRNITLTTQDNSAQNLLNYVRTTDYTSTSAFGIVKIDPTYLTVTNGVLGVDKNKILQITSRNIKFF